MNTKVKVVTKELNGIGFLQAPFYVKHLVFFFVFVFSALNMRAQIIKCATWEVEQELRSQYPQIGTVADFENWMQTNIESQVHSRDATDATIVPVIFHIIHNGDNIGTGDNISANFIYAQIEQLNNDFGKVSGTSGDNNEAVGAVTDIRFCPALTEPNGDLLVEPGIDRINRNDMGWTAPPYAAVIPTSYFETTIKPVSQWNPDQYLNIWVSRIFNPANNRTILGYSTMPIQSGLPGLPDAFPANRDGVVVIPSSIGSTELPFPTGDPYNQGRTLTHELGHFFGLRHIWGDGPVLEGCTVDDFCDDTPNAARPNSGCPTSHESCGSIDMVRNYMDYTDDACMNIFTEDQKARMDVVRKICPRRMFSQVTCNSIGCGVFENTTITEDVTWDEETVPLGVVSMGTIFVHSDATLTINTPISFGPGGGIYIYSGGKVILNSTLTSCDRWNGIRIFENAEFKSNPGSVIEHAVWGISSTEWGNFLGTAKINCNGTTFRDNAVAAMIATKNGLGIERQAYDAKFTNCEFINDDDMRHEKFWTFIASYNIKGVTNGLSGVQVGHCNFTDLQTNSTYPNTWNSGIVALNGDAAVFRSTFKNLYSGVEARIGVSDNPYLTLWESKFYDCGYGVINSGISGSAFLENTFNFGSLPMETQSGEQVGVVLQDQMNDIYFRENVFQYAPTGNDPMFFKWSEGTYVNNVGADKNNKIGKNYYTNIDYANIARGNNANVDNGLHYLCNHNSSNSRFDFIGFSGVAMRKNQGKAEENQFLPAGNTFSHLSWDFGNFGQNKVRYYYNALDDAQKPGGSTGNNGYFAGIELKPRKPSDFCSTEGGRPKLKNLAEAVANEGDYQTYWETYQGALEEYNSAKSSSNLELSKTKKARLTYESNRLGQVVALGYDYARKHSDKNELRKWIRRFDNVAGDYLLVGDYFSTGEYEQALDVLQDMMLKRQLTEKEMIDLEKVTNIYKTIAEDGLDNLDASFLNDLESYAESKEGKSCFLARTILRNSGQYYDPIVDIPVQFGQTENETSNGESTSMSVSPNPTDYQVTFDWSEFNTLGKEVRIEIANQTGMLIDVLHPEDGNTSIEWTTEKVSGSSCHYGLFIDGQEVDSGQIIINK